MAIYALSMRFLPALLVALFLLLPPPALADSQAELAQGLLRLLPKDSITERTITVRGQQLTYVATAGTLDDWIEAFWRRRDAAVWCQHHPGSHS